MLLVRAERVEVCEWDEAEEVGLARAEPEELDGPLDMAILLGRAVLGVAGVG